MVHSKHDRNRHDRRTARESHVTRSRTAGATFLQAPNSCRPQQQSSGSCRGLARSTAAVAAYSRLLLPCSPAAHLLLQLLLAVLVDRVAAAFELDDSTLDRRLVVVSACTLVAALLLLLLLLMADGQSSHLLLGEQEEAAQRQAAPATARGLPSVERHELRAKSEHRDARKKCRAPCALQAPAPTFG